MNNSKHTFGLAMLVITGFAAAFAGCSSDSKNATPPTGTGGSATGGGGASSGGTSSGGTSSGGTSFGGTSSGGTSPEAGTGGTSSGGSGTGGASGVDAGCVQSSGCWACTATTNTEFMNHCTSRTCVDYDNSQLTAIVGGVLPPLP